MQLTLRTQRFYRLIYEGWLVEKNVRVKELVAELEGSLIAYVRGFVKDAEAARDIVQEGFLRLWQHPEHMDEKAKSWLYVVCRNLALDQLRRQKVAHTHRDKLVQEDTAPSDTFVEDKQDMQEVVKVFGTLSEQEQEVLRLKFQSEMSYKEISEVTGMSVNQVGVVIHNGLKKLRKRVEQ